MQNSVTKTINRDRLDALYAKYNRREFVHPDPLEFLYEYPDIRDREIVGLIASGLAYGRVAQILKSVRKVLENMPGPVEFLANGTPREFGKVFQGFKHRFTTGEDLAGLLAGIKRVREEYGSLNRCFLAGGTDQAETVYEAGLAFSNTLSGGKRNSLLPLANGKSACKRLHLFLRWMVRKDAVDPGGWEGIPESKLVIPLDTHMHKMSIRLGLTRRKQADAKTAHEITRAFRRIVPEDAVKYDFSLTRPGIRGEKEVLDF
jgi:uncharacterized protein (TIGR02757 family)